jgi:oxalate decarboxylase/phosphoglucose isomerase-like protein (cupin superfamily)
VGASAGTVVFNVTNTGTVTHEMVVVRTRKPAGELAQGSSASEKGSVGEVSDLESGRTRTCRFP